MQLAFFKVAALPAQLVANAFYFVDNGTVAESYLTGNDAVARSLGNTSLAQQIADSRVTQALADYNLLEYVDDIAARDALNPQRNVMVLVLDASGDATVSTGAALYAFREADSSWTKLTEYEGLDVTVSWADIQGKPASSASQIDDAVSKRHAHSNKAVLDKFSEVAGKPYYDGEALASQWEQTAW